MCVRQRSPSKTSANADEIFCSGNYSKVSPVIKLDDRELQAGPVARKALDLYMDWAKSTVSAE